MSSNAEKLNILYIGNFPFKGEISKSYTESIVPYKDKKIYCVHRILKKHFSWINPTIVGEFQKKENRAKDADLTAAIGHVNNNIHDSLSIGRRDAAIRERFAKLQAMRAEEEAKAADA